MNIPILYEDQDLLVLNKPAGLMVHGDSRSKEETLVDWVNVSYPMLKDVGEPIKLNDGSQIQKSGIVHRLDKETSGVILIAKNQETYEYLKQQFKDRLISKVYTAIVWGNIKNETGIIDAPIARSKNDFRQWSAQRGKRGEEREAVTEYKVLKRFKINEESVTVIKVMPKTGRTHQIRVHMKFLNNPVVCDSLYAPNKPCPVLGLSRLALHANSIEFKLPKGEMKIIEAPIPDDLKSFLD